MFLVANLTGFRTQLEKAANRVAWDSEHILWLIGLNDYHLGCAKILTDHDGARSSGQVQKWARSPWRSRLRPAELEEFAAQVEPSRCDAVINVDDICCARHSWTSISSVLQSSSWLQVLDTPMLILCDAVSARCEVRDWVLSEWLNFLWWFHINSTVCLIKGDLLPANLKISTKEWIEDYPRTAFRRAVQTPFELLRAGSAFIYT